MRKLKLYLPTNANFGTLDAPKLYRPRAWPIDWPDTVIVGTVEYEVINVAAVTSNVFETPDAHAQELPSVPLSKGAPPTAHEIPLQRVHRLFEGYVAALVFGVKSESVASELDGAKRLYDYIVKRWHE